MCMRLIFCIPRYVLPQVRRYKTHGAPKGHDYTYSCLALDRTSNPARYVPRHSQLKALFYVEHLEINTLI